MIRVSEFYKGIFGKKVYKISLDAGCTCPNRDGTKGVGGCHFCSATGSGDFTGRALLASDGQDIARQMDAAKALVAGKVGAARAGEKVSAGGSRYIAYFQSFSNTYGEPARLQKIWEQVLEDPEICGIAIATRPDCLSAEVLDVLGKLAQKTYLQVELGLQTSNERTAVSFNRGYENFEYEDAVKNLHNLNKNIHVVTHIIFGLPDETESDMLNSVDFAVKCGTDGIKITNLYVVEGTKYAQLYAQGKIRILGMEEYLELLGKSLKLIPEEMVVHRLTGDPPKKILIEPQWSANKKVVINRINQLLF